MLNRYPRLVLYKRSSRLLRSCWHFEIIYRTRGAAIIELAYGILGRSRGSPTAKNKVPALQAIAKTNPILGENDFACDLVAILLDKARMIPKPGFTPGQALAVDDFMPDPKAWKEDFLGQWLSFPLVGLPGSLGLSFIADSETDTLANRRSSNKSEIPR